MGVALKEARQAVTGRHSVNSWCRRHTIGGDGAVAAAGRGHRSGQDCALTREQELDLIDLIRGRYPDQLGLTEELWTRQSVAAMVNRQYGLPLGATEMDGYLRDWGLGPRKPTDRACGLCVDAVTGWLDRAYPAILRTAHEHRAELCWIGRTRLHGVVPAADVLSAVPVRGPIRFMITTPAVEPPLSRDFLLRLSGPDAHPVHVVVDGSWTRGEWSRRLPPRIVAHPLPSCGRALSA